MKFKFVSDDDLPLKTLNIYYVANIQSVFRKYDEYYSYEIILEKS